jgi:ADP-heptose:LPS heptosyltransferase
LAKLFRSSISQFSWDEHFLVADVSKKHNFTQKYQEIAKDKIKIGIIWQNKHERISMEQLKPLLTNNEYFFISLQAGPTNLHPNIYIEDTLNTAIDMDGLAACVASLDYVIGVDSQSIHLASSIGTPSFVITSFASNWYWFTQRCTSPWYTATTIVRQDDKINYINSLAQIHKIIQANKPQS